MVQQPEQATYQVRADFPARKIGKIGEMHRQWQTETPQARSIVAF
jgi:hypothetical protein